MEPDPLFNQSEKELLDRINLGDHLLVKHYGPDGRIIAQRTGDGIWMTSTDFTQSGVRKEQVRITGAARTEDERNLEIVQQLFLEFNRVYSTDFAGPYIPQDLITRKKRRDTPTDVEVVSRSNPDKKLQIQITSSESDQMYRRKLTKIKAVVREEVSASPGRMKEVISKKVIRYGEKTCKDLLLVIDAWPTLTERDVDEFLKQEKDFLDRAPFLDVWIVSLEAHFTIHLRVADKR